MGRVKKILSLVFVGLIIILTGYILIFGSIARKNNNLLTFFGYSYSIVPTNSMAGSYEDSIEPVSVIISKNTSFDNLEINDIVVFKSNDNTKLIVHRIVRIDEDGYFITKGDNPNNSEDGPLYQDNYQAKVVEVIKVSNLLSQTNSIQVAILLFLMLTLGIYSIYQILVIVKTIYSNRLDKIKEDELNALREEVKKEIEENNDQEAS